MSSDGYFDGVDDFDEEALGQLDAIEAAHFSPVKRLSLTPPFSARIPPLSTQDSFYNLSLDVNENELAELDNFIEDAYQGIAKPVAVAGPRKFGRSTSSNKLQTTLFGDVIQPVASSNTSKPKSTIERTKSVPRNPFGQQAPKTKKWDQTAFAKSGGPKGKGKGKARQEDGEEGGEDAVEFEQFPNPLPPPFVPSELLGNSPLRTQVLPCIIRYYSSRTHPMKLKPDLLEVKHWIYPINRPKRDYQYNIIKNCLFNNTLVALPTGLGKTLIAGVLMLNYYRWFPEGKVVFVAPTKPLVAQQVNACLETCGIPGRDSVELTGEVPKVQRVKHWVEKRVFFMTPQTLQNDLEKMVCDARDIVLLVVDEAHRATGDYAYNRVIRFLMATNPYFRVLALTATPGNKFEAVQILIDGLHISHIELRDDQSLDLQPYIHKKVIKTHIIKANEDVGKIRDMIANVMDPIMKTLKQRGLLAPSESPISMHPYRPQMVMKELRPHQAGFYVSLAKLSSLARGMMYLLTGSIGACYESLKEASRNKEDDDGESGKKKDHKSKSLRDDPHFKLLMLELETQRNRGFGTHPKVEKLKQLLIQHFGSKLGDETEDDNVDDTRVMVFSSYRAVVDEIVEELSRDRPLIRATRFIGQSVDKQGNKGLPQKEQLEVIKKFKAGEYNVLVATSIGEEGLDIGEIDVTICYDADKAPTRMVQRFGRTGRKRAGMVHALLAEGREENNIDKADAAHKEVNKTINKGQHYELYGDVHRLLPDHIKPECLEKVVEIEAYVREEKRKRGSPRKNDSTQAKRKRNDDVVRNIPDGASTGFVSVRELLVKAPKKRKAAATMPKNFETCGEDDETDDDIACGRVLAPARRTQSAVASSDKPPSKPNLRKSATLGGTKVTKPKRTKKKVSEPTPSQFSKQGADDSDDMDIVQGTILPANTATPEFILQPSPQSTPMKPVHDSILELSDSEPGHLTLSENQTSPSFPEDDQDMGWIVDDDDDNLDFEIVDSSPLIPKSALPPLERMHVGNDSIEISIPQNCRPLASSSKKLVNDSVKFIEPAKKKTVSNRKLLSSSPPEVLSSHSPDAKFPISGSTSSLRPITLSPLSSPYKTGTSPAPNVEATAKAMLPPALPCRFLASPANLEDDVPEPSFPIRPIGFNNAKRRRITFNDDGPESPLDEMPAPSQRRRLHRVESTPPVRKSSIKGKSKRTKPSLLSRNPNILFDGEAIHSGDEVSEGRSGTEDEESESDRLFLKDSPATQASQSYDQSLAYRQSLLTQAPANNIGILPMFANRPTRHKPFGRMDGARSRRFLPSSSPPLPDEDLDYYDLDSFVVDDDEEIS